jgi:hypothetical protein
MRPLVLATLLAALGCGVNPSAANVTPVLATDATAVRYIGKRATVTGLVAQVKDHAHHGFAYLNFGRPHPDESFAILVPDSALARFGDLGRFEGHQARATGVLWLQDGKYPAMTLTDPTALELLP